MGDKEKIYFIKVPLAQINPSVELPTDIYLKMAKKYIKFKEKGDSITCSKYDLFLAKNVPCLYIPSNQKDLFNTWLEQIKDASVMELVAAVGEDKRHLVEKTQKIKEVVYKTFSDEALSNETVEILRGQVSEFIAAVREKDLSLDFLTQINNMNSNITDHSINVANFSVFLAMALGHGHQFVLENVYLGGLLHDYGKAKIDSKILENPNSNTYSQAIQDHPYKGAELVSKIKQVPEQVLTIIRQHHEQFNGGGYPEGLRGDVIYELAKIITIANVFDNASTDSGVVQTNSPRTVEMNRKAIKIISFDRGKNFDTMIIPRVLDALNIAFNNMEKKACQIKVMKIEKNEQIFLLQLAKKSIGYYLQHEEIYQLSKDESSTCSAKGVLADNLGCFVTLKRGCGELRGCIGLISAETSLYQNVVDYAVRAAFEDPRFPPLERDEFPDLKIEISVMGPITPVGPLENIEIGKHGLIIRNDFSHGLLLPQVAIEHNMDRTTFLEQTCLKAGLSRNAYKDSATEILFFSADVFGED